MQKEENKRRVQADAAVEKKNAVGEWLELLASQDDAAWKENLIGMGSAPNVPKLFHNNGKVTPAHFAHCQQEGIERRSWSASQWELVDGDMPQYAAVQGIRWQQHT